MTDSYISIDEFAKVEIRVGKVESAENVEKSEKLIKLCVDFGAGDRGDTGNQGNTEDQGEEKSFRTIYTGVRGYGYAPEDFSGKQFLFVTNLAPRKMPGGESQGMILAVDDADNKPAFIKAEGLPLGSKIR